MFKKRLLGLLTLIFGAMLLLSLMGCDLLEPSKDDEEGATGSGTQTDPYTLSVGGSATGEITAEQPAVWYKFTANGSYVLTVRDSYYPSYEESIYTVDVRTSVMNSSFAFISDVNGVEMDAIDSDNNPDITFTNLSGVHYVKIQPYSEGGVGTFYIALATYTSAPGTQGNPITLNVGSNLVGNLTEALPVMWYKFTANGNYKLTVRDSYYKPADGSMSPYTVDVKTSVMNSSYVYIADINGRVIEEIDSDNDPDFIFTNLSGVYYVMVLPYTTGNVGSFYIALASHVVAPGDGTLGNPYTLNVGSGLGGNLTAAQQEIWYRFTANGNYELIVRDSYYPEGSGYTVDVKTTVSNSQYLVINDANGRELSEIDLSGNFPRILLTELSGVYNVKVQPYFEDDERNHGTFYIELANYTPPPPGDGTQGNPIILFPFLGSTGYLTELQQEIWFKFHGDGDYQFVVEDSYYPGNSSYTCDVVASVYNSSFEPCLDDDGDELLNVDFDVTRPYMDLYNKYGDFYVKITPYYPEPKNVGSFQVQLIELAVGAPPVAGK